MPTDSRPIRRLIQENSGSSDESTPRIVKRGRPPKPLGWRPDPEQYSHISDEKDKKYIEMRIRNNESSRKSRFNRKEKDMSLNNEADELERRHKWLSDTENKLRREVERWKRGVIELTLLP